MCGRINQFVPVVWLLICGSQPGFGVPRTPFPGNVPNADIVPHGRFLISGQVNHFQSVSGEFSPEAENEIQFPFSTGVTMGIMDRAQFGVQFGNVVSFSWKAYVVEGSGKLYWPEVSLGVRNLFSSQEATLYNVTDEWRGNWLKNESYLVFSSLLHENTRLHLGAAMPGLAKLGEGTFFLGVEQTLGLGTTISYELIERFDEYRHFFSMWFQYKSFSFLIGLVEAQAWLMQDGEFGFFSAPNNGVPDGYGSPGLRFVVSVGGWAIRKNRKTERGKISSLELVQEKQKKKIKSLTEFMDKTEQRLARLEKKRSQTWWLENARINEYLEMLHKKINSDVPYNPKEIIDLQERILALKGNTNNILESIVTNPASDAGHRSQACIVMGISGISQFIKPLLKATEDPEPIVRREAILALGKMKVRIALAKAQELTEDLDDTVRLAAEEAIRLINSGDKEDEEMIDMEFPDVP